MATTDDVVTNQMILNVASGIRTVTRTTEGMTVPEMPERLLDIRVVEVNTLMLDFSTMSPVSLGVYDVNVKHLFVVTPRSSADALLLKRVNPEANLRYDQSTGELSMTYADPQTVQAELLVIDLLLSDKATSSGVLIIQSEDALQPYDSDRHYDAGELFLYRKAESDYAVAVTVVSHAAEPFNVEHNRVLANQVVSESSEVEYKDLYDMASTVANALQAHIDDKMNPHCVTKAQISLANVDNTADIDKPVSTAQQAALDLKVDKVAGKQLSSNDFTDASVAKLATISSNAQVNVIESIDVNNVEQPIVGKKVSISVPTKLSQLEDTTPISPVSRALGDSEGNNIGSTYVKVAAIVNNLMSTDTNKPLSAAQGKALKAIIDSQEFGKAYADMQSMVLDLNAAAADRYRIASNLLIVQMSVPDFWVVSVEAVAVDYTYTTDAALIEAVNSEPVQIGYYKISKLETAKVDLSEYVMKSLTIAGIALNGDISKTALQDAIDFDTKVDKVTGKQLSSNDFTDAEKTKLSGIAENANNYIHPVSHSPSIITQDTNNRFMTDAERNKLSGIEANANKYIHPATHPASIIAQDANNRFVTDTEKSTWNAKASTAVATTTNNGLMASADKVKLNGIEAGAQVNKVTSVAGRAGAVTLAKADVGLSNVDNTKDIDKPISTATQTALDLKADKTSIPTSLPANGGNADTIGGKYPADFVPATRTINGKSLSSDINLATDDIDGLPETIEQINNNLIDIVSPINTVGSNLNIDNTNDGYIDKLELLGNTLGGNGTPTSPIAIKGVGGECNIKTCKLNLFDETKFINNEKNTSGLSIENGYYKNSGFSGFGWLNNTRVQEGETYTISVVGYGNKTADNILSWYLSPTPSENSIPNGSCWIKQMRFTNSSSTIDYTFTVPAGMHYLFCYCAVASSETLYFKEPMLNEGSVSLPYERFVGNYHIVPLKSTSGDSIKLYKIGTTQDRIYQNGDKWYVEKWLEYGEVMPPTTSADNPFYKWRFCSIGNGALPNHDTSVYVQTYPMYPPFEYENTMLCNRFIVSLANWSSDVQAIAFDGSSGDRSMRIRVNNEHTGILPSDDTSAMVSKMNAFLENNTIAFIIKLTTPKVIELHPDTINALKSIRTYAGGTNIIATDTPPAILDITELQIGTNTKYVALKGKNNAILFPVNMADNVLMNSGETVEQKLNDVNTISTQSQQKTPVQYTEKTIEREHIGENYVETLGRSINLIPQYPCDKYIYHSANFDKITLSLKPNTKYTYSALIEGDSILYADPAFKTFTNSTTRQAITFTTSETGNQIIYVLKIGSEAVGIVANTLPAKMMLNEGDIELPYEYYQPTKQLVIDNEGKIKTRIAKDNTTWVEYNQSLSTIKQPDTTYVLFDAVQGSNTLHTQPNNAIHEYAKAGRYLISIKAPVIDWGDGTTSTISSFTGFTVDGASNANSYIEIDLGNDLTKINANAFSNCNKLTRIFIPKSVTTINNRAFYKCKSLTNIVIPNSVASISYSVFSQCESLTNIVIPSSVTTIGASAFNGCTALRKITLSKNTGLALSTTNIDIFRNVRLNELVLTVEGAVSESNNVSPSEKDTIISRMISNGVSFFSRDNDYNVFY